MCDGLRRRGTAALMYHDVNTNCSGTRSGFQGDGAARYKIDAGKFLEHLREFKEAGLGSQKPDAGHCQLRSAGFYLTFDDGGSSAPAIADMLERFGFRGLFFVPSDYVGRPGFVSAKDLIDLDARGHTIGSHSRTHPSNMARLSDQDLLAEWKVSSECLSQIVGRQILCGSVPNGRYSRRVARCASIAGLRLLFTSEPKSVNQTIAECTVQGRYTIVHNTTARKALSLAVGPGAARVIQYVSWNFRKCLKLSCEPLYSSLRRSILDDNRMSRDSQR